MWYEFLPSILGGAVLTLQLALGSLLLALVVGLLGAIGQLSGLLWLGALVRLAINTLRGIPELVLMLLVYYGGQVLVNRITDAAGLGYLDINPFVAGVCSLGVLYGAYFAETFRGAFLAIPHGQREAARAYCLPRWRAFMTIELPQMLRFALPGLTNNWLVLLKGTAIVSVIGLTDMTWLADQAGRTTREPFLFYSLVCLVYLAITAVSTRILGYIERRLAVPFRHHPG